MLDTLGAEMIQSNALFLLSIYIKNIQGETKQLFNMTCEMSILAFSKKLLQSL